MSNLFNLLKINLSSYLSLNNWKNSESYSIKIATGIKVLLFISLYFIIGLFIYNFAKYMANGFATLNMSSLILSEFFSISSVFILAISIFKIDIFSSMDRELLLSLPIKKSTIIASKLLNLYLFNLLVVLLLMVPAIIVYISYNPVAIDFYLRTIIGIIMIPIIPTTIAVFISSLITIVSTKFRFTKIIQTLLMLLLIVVSIVYSFNLNSSLELNLLDIPGSFANFFDKLYPLTNRFTSMLITNDFISATIFIGVSLLSLVITIIFLSLFYTKITAKVYTSNQKYLVRYGRLKDQTPLKHLFLKDLKRIIYSPNYLLNSCLGLIFILLFSVFLLFFDLDNYTSTPLTKAVLTQNLPLVFMFIIFLSCTTSSSISIEGKNFYILKMLPVKFKTIWIAKVLCNYLLITITCLMSLFLFNISLDLTIDIIIKSIVLIFASGLFISLFGLFINLLFPNFTWKSEIKVIKQSASSFITVFSGLLLGIFLAFNNYTSTTGYTYYISAIFLIVSIILIIFLNTIGTKIYQKLSII